MIALEENKTNFKGAKTIFTIGHSRTFNVTNWGVGMVIRDVTETFII